MTGRGHIPIRSCIGCRGKRAKADLLRFVLRGEQAEFDAAQALPGRGCYLCNDPQCLETAIRRKAFDRALKRRNVRTEHLAAVFKNRESNTEPGVSG